MKANACFKYERQRTQIPMILKILMYYIALIMHSRENLWTCCTFSVVIQPLNGKKVQHMDTVLSVSTVLVPSTRWEAQKSCSIVPLVGLGGLSKRFVATGFLTWRHALLSSTFCKKCAKYEIQKDDVNVTNADFKISRFCMDYRNE